MVQEVVVVHVDEELSGSRVRIARTSHGDRVLVVLQAVLSFVFDRFMGFFFFQARQEATALNHEAFDDAMENHAVIEAFTNITFKVSTGSGGVVVIEFDIDNAFVGCQTNHGVVSFNLSKEKKSLSFLLAKELGWCLSLVTHPSPLP